MRPRSWWSWARPKRSACSMTMMLAFGTLTPTSMTVVETRSYPVGVEVLHDALLLGGRESAMDEAARDAAKDAEAQLVVDLLG